MIELIKELSKVILKAIWLIIVIWGLYLLFIDKWLCGKFHFL